MLTKSKHVLLQLQRVQQVHDEVAHRDILSFDLYKKLKHMVLHFYKYAGRIEQAKDTRNMDVLGGTLIDTFIICMASANALNISLDAAIGKDAETMKALTQLLHSESKFTDPFEASVRELLVIGGKMAKAIESSDHMERGDPRQQMELLVPMLTKGILACLDTLPIDVETTVKSRLAAVETKSIFKNLELA
jgi:hypothetical protein